jgi:hypothetical protein
MATNKLPKRVPLFTAYEIKLAELCAKALWEGIDFRTNELAEISDELLLNNFHVSFQSLVKRPALPSLITEFDLRRLIRVCELKAMYRSTLPLDFAMGISGIKTIVVPLYKASTRNNPKIDRQSASIKSLLNLSLAWVNNPNKSLNGNYRVPLSTRVLFFCAPEMLIFNFSNELARRMNLQTRPQAALTYFNKLLIDGMELNKLLLNELKIPERSSLSEVNWNNIKNTDWWQRRVLDIALINKFGVSAPHPSFSAAARKVTRVSTKKPTQ